MVRHRTPLYVSVCLLQSEVGNRMGLFFYQALAGQHASTQAYLGSIRKCVNCNTNQPKETFKFHVAAGVDMCKECLDDDAAELEAMRESHFTSDSK